MSILKMIEARLDSMAPADRAIGAWIVAHPDRMLRITSSALAAAAGHSQSAVVKFSQKLGFARYQDLKLAVSEARAQGPQSGSGLIHGSIEQGDGCLSIQRKLVASKLYAMQQTVAANGEQAMGRALEALDLARRVHLAGVGASSLVALDFSYKLLKLGRAVIHSGDSHVQMANVSGIGRQDVLLALSHTGRSIETLRIAELAKARGAQVIAVTGLRGGPLARIADLVLRTVADEDRVRSSSITVRDAQLTLTDLLFLLLVQRQDDAHDFIRESEAAVAVLKPGG